MSPCSSSSSPFVSRPLPGLPATAPPALAAALLTLAPAILSVLTPTPVRARPSPGAPTPSVPSPRTDEFSGWFHNAGNLLLHVSNRGLFGTRNEDGSYPSAEWPAGSSDEYLWAAGLWVGGVIRRAGAPDTLVSAGLYQIGEFANIRPGDGCGTPPEGICETFEGAPSGQRRFDDDGDGRIDEDPLDGVDNDGDGRTDEDFAGISQQMFRSVYWDTSTFANAYVTDPSNRHTPLGLRVEQESYVWTDPQFDDFVGVEFRVTNVSELLDDAGWDIERSYIGFMVDADVGKRDVENMHRDDRCGYAELDTTVSTGSGGDVALHLTMGYMFDQPGAQVNDDVPGYLGVMFLGHTTDTTSGSLEESLAPRQVGIHAFRVWSSDGGDARDDEDRYRFLRGLRDTARTIDSPPTRPRDYRFLVSAGPFARIPPGSTLTFQVAFVCGEVVWESDPDTGDPVARPDFTNPLRAQRIYDGFVDDASGETIHWATSTPPPPPNLAVTPGDHSVVLEWDDFPERSPDPLTRELDFAGYQVWKAEGWRRDSNVPSDEMWRLIADFDSTELSDVDSGRLGVGKYRFVDTRVQNGFWYWYAVSAYDRGRTERTVLDVDFSSTPPETTWWVRRVEPPRYGKYTQNMQRVMPAPTSTQTLAEVFAAPNPYRGEAAWDLAETRAEPTGRRIRFFNLPERATIRIYTLAGDHVVTLEHDARGRGPGDPSTAWNLVSKNNQAVASGIYLYRVESPTGETATGKIVVIL